MLKIFLYIFLKLILSLYIYRKRKFINNVIFDNIIQHIHINLKINKVYLYNILIFIHRRC